MPTINVSEELQAAIDVAVREGEYSDAAEYIGRLVRQDQKQRAKEQLLASLATEGGGDEVEALADAWRKLRVERHRDSDDE